MGGMPLYFCRNATGRKLEMYEPNLLTYVVLFAIGFIFGFTFCSIIVCAADDKLNGRM